MQYTARRARAGFGIIFEKLYLLPAHSHRQGAETAKAQCV
jgi:hypothetical protein